VAPDQTAPRGPNTTITWTASASGGEGPLQYKWAVFDGTTTTVVDWSANATYQWTPTVSNANYQVSVRVRGGWNSGYAEQNSAAVAFPIQARVSTVTLTPSVASPQATGTPITWTAAPSGGLAPLLYRFQVTDGVTTTVLSNWLTTNTVTWVPTTASGSYVVNVRVRAQSNTVNVEATADENYVVKPRVASVTVAPNVSAPRAANTTITWTASATGGEGPLQYKWAVFDGTTTTVVADWSTNATYQWTPTVANANYQVSVRVRGGWNSGNAEQNSAPVAFPIQ
jgi:hypothetical protein